ncbi:bifunctional 2',3'-cyclic-nucleotide 2'-phosphodiesterase/3'-nucleotidase [Neobacillus terrae]|uniref:bifunctional 2',3'-cyclic-nucleotide 2'-phosphodiesterase/3'-nucleotidase n=1 Tax=Neobacillus terrae TaxID=3034837 RepID=UPI00140B78CF|nr:bifunctional 2',3'-cyclic-nucleotide 2'-phosphodiesterase/3'-nucleotidase [Neobacillus terrae]NHM31863.1 bifunctional 2',3'-cyclic-nucleotide 2'-phosphodiesterase/3'-nucleotidase [Neobacillus terrae]
MVKIQHGLALLTLLPFLISPLFQATSSVSAAQQNLSVDLRLLETTDLHVSLANYNYYQSKEDNKVGLVKTATLIRQARKEASNSLLFDNGDNLQGNPLGDYIGKVKGLKTGAVHPVYRAFNFLKYDAITLGNHEFNYGLDFLNTALKGAKMPVVNANVYKASQNKAYFKPYTILKRKVTDSSGKKRTLRIGVIGFVPPQIMEWDKTNLEGKVEARSIVESAKKYIPAMKKSGADIIIALAHTGISAEPYTPWMEDAAYYLTFVPGIDAIFAGHSHRIFPGPLYKDLPNVDLNSGTINGKPVVMAGSFGNTLGIIDLKLEKKQGKWKILTGKGFTRQIADDMGNSLVETDEALLKIIKPEHTATIKYVNSPVGETSTPIHSYFSLVQDDPSVQLLNMAQTDYLTKKLREPSYTKYAGIPVLSAAAPFKAGGRGGPSYYTDIPAGTLAIRNIADLYLYPNSLQAVLVNGGQLKEWLEMSAGQFRKIDPSSRQEQLLIDPNFRSYNFDVIDGIKYQIDVTRPAKYDAVEKLINPNTSRIINLTYKGKPVTPNQKFIVAANSYRASSTTFPGVSKGEVILKAPYETRQILTDFIKENKRINPSADKNWAISPVRGFAITFFESSPEAQKYAKLTKNITYAGPSSGGFARYLINLENGE